MSYCATSIHQLSISIISIINYHHYHHYHQLSISIINYQYPSSIIFSKWSTNTIFSVIFANNLTKILLYWSSKVYRHPSSSHQAEGNLFPGASFIAISSLLPGRPRIQSAGIVQGSAEHIFITNSCSHKIRISWFKKYSRPSLQKKYIFNLQITS